jgi:hypothetical protein
MSFRLQTKLALHHSSYPVDKFFSIHAGNFLSLAALEPELEILVLGLVDFEPETAGVAVHYN